MDIFGSKKRLGLPAVEARAASAVAGFAQKLRGNGMLEGWNYYAIADAAAEARGDDQSGYRNSLVPLVRLAGALAPEAVAPPREAE